MIEALHLLRWVIFITSALTGSSLGILLKKNGLDMPFRKDNFLSLGSLGNLLLGIFLSYGFVLAEFEAIYPVTTFLCFLVCAGLTMLDDSVRNRLIRRFMAAEVKELVKGHEEESIPAPEPVPEPKPAPEPKQEIKPG